MNEGVPPADVIRLLSRGVFLELVRKKDLYVVGLLMGLFLVVAWSVQLVGIESEASATFLLNLGLSLSGYCVHLLSLFLMIRQVPSEIENRTLFPLLARPFDRQWYLVGKWLACSGPMVGLLMLLFILILVLVPGGGRYDGLLMVQMLCAQCLSICMLNALTLLASLCWPRSIGILVLGALYFVSDKLIRVIGSAFSEAPLNGISTYLANLLPDFSKLNLITRYTDGIPALGIGEFLGVVFYGLLWIAVALIPAGRLFRRRNL